MRPIVCGLTFLVLIACGNDSSDGGSSNANTVPSCKIEIDTKLMFIKDDYTGKPITDFTARLIGSESDAYVRLSLTFVSDANGDTNIDVGDSVMMAPGDQTVESGVEGDQFEFSLSYAKEFSEIGLWDSVCPEGMRKYSDEEFLAKK
jgi:hypothetical protein